MGLLDNKVTYYVSYEKDDIDGVANYLEKEIGGDYKVKLNKYSNGLAKRIVSGKSEDHVFIEKNGYHRCNIFLSHTPADQTESQKEEMIFHITRAKLGGVIGFLNKELGMIGRFIIGLIYGKADEFYDAIFQAMTKKYDIEERNLNVGVSSLFKKKK